LKNLLAPKLYDQFAEDAKARAAKDYVMETTLHKIATATITGARMIGFEAEVTVEFISEQTSAVRDSASQIIAGDPNAREEIRDLWTFRRDTRGNDPSWHLVETRE
jgi:predicted lipid-binding transport protein (Tim44 family)